MGGLQRKIAQMDCREELKKVTYFKFSKKQSQKNFRFILRNVVSLLTLKKTLLIAFTSIYLVKVYLQNR